MNRKIAYIAGAVVVVCALAVAGLHAAQGQFRAHAGTMIIRHIERDLGITDEQRASIRQILAEERPTILSLVKRLDEQNQKIQSEETFDEAQIRAKVAQESDTIADAIVERERVRSRIMQVLTPAQREKAKSLRDEFRLGMMNRLANLGDEI